MYPGQAQIYPGIPALGTKLYLGLPALSFHVVPGACSPRSMGLAALGLKKCIGRSDYDLALKQELRATSLPQAPIIPDGTQCYCSQVNKNVNSPSSALVSVFIISATCAFRPLLTRICHESGDICEQFAVFAARYSALASQVQHPG